MSRRRTEPTALPPLSPDQKSAVLDELVGDDVELERRAEQAGHGRPARISA